nr:retrovirus-related Pol polyprotein from transposon TNT 1-94 [Tanacetum cinerariifolium]
MNMGQDRQMQMVGGNVNLNGSGNLVAARAEGNAAGHNGNQIRCYNCRGVGHFARNCTVRPRRRDATYLQTQLLIAQKEEAGIQLQAEEFDLMAAAADLDEIEEVNANCILMANLQQASNIGINPFKTSREERHMPNKVRASVRTNPITVSQPPFITKKVVNSDSNGLSFTGVDNTKTRRPQLRSNTKNERVLSASKSSQSKNKEVKVEKHHRNLILSRNKKHMSSECNNVKLATHNVKVVCAMCKQCLNSVNHDVCLLNYVNSMTSRGKKQTTNVSINETQKKQQPKVKKTKKVGSIERLASPKPSKPRSFLRWSQTGRLFDLKGKIIVSSESESQSDCSNGDNACTSNPLEPKIKRFPNSTSFLGRVYFIEGLGHNLFSVGQFCDSDLEVVFRRNTCFVRNLEGVDLLKGNRTIDLYTINLHEMASAFPICLMDRASSTKSWLWNQRLSHLNFGTINDLAKNDLVSGLPKFKYHKEHLCPSCEVYNRRTKKIMKTMNVSFDELSAMAFEQRSSKPRLQSMSSGQISSRLDLTYAPSTITTQQPIEDELDLLFEAMYDDYIGGQPSAALRTGISVYQFTHLSSRSMTPSE